MKRLAIILWVIGSLLVVLGAFFKVMHYAGSAMLMMMGFLAAATSLLLGFITRKKTNTP